MAAKGAQDEPGVQGQHSEEDLSHRGAEGEAERLHPLPALAAEGGGVGETRDRQHETRARLEPCPSDLGDSVA